MKRTQIKDALRNIRKLQISFWSIVVIAALGVTIFLGVDYAAAALRKNATAYYQNTGFRDVEIVSTMLLSGEDMDVIRNTEGVTDVEGVYMTSAKAVSNDTRMDAYVISVTERINIPSVYEGRLPENVGECAVERRLMDQMGWKVGDTIAVTSAEGTTPQYLNADSFVICGAILHPDHACNSIPETLYIVVTPEAFDTEALDGCFMKAEIMADCPIDMNRYDAEYRTTALTVRERMEAAAETRAPLREAAVKAQIEENQQKLDDAEAELENGRKELDDGWQQLAEGERDYEEGKQKLEDARKQLDETKQQLADAERKLKDGRAELDAAKAELEAGKAQLDAAEQKLDSASEQLVSGWNTIEDAKTQIRNKLHAGLDDVIGEDSSQWIRWANPTEANPNSAGVSASDFWITDQLTVNFGASLSGKIDQLMHTVQIPDRVLRIAFEKLGGEGEYDPDVARQLLADRVASLAGEYQSQYDALADGCTKWDEGHETYLSGLRQYREGLAKYEEALKLYQEGEAQYAEGLAQYEDGLSQYNDGEAQYAQGLIDLENGRKELDDARAKLEDGEQSYADGLKQYNEGREALQTAQKRIEALGPCKWIVTDGFGNVSFVQLGTAANNLKSMEMTFALLFVLVGALVIYATVSKMVDEQRRQIGTTKALGFFNREIFAKYLLFGISATLLGCVIGLLIARFGIQGFITNGYNLYFDYNLKKPAMVALPTVIVFLAGILLAFFSIWFACAKLLRTPAIRLMQQAVPKGRNKAASGKKSALSLYSRLILLNIRTDFRRVLVTVVSVAGCCALVVIGITIRNAVSNSLELQLNEIIRYDGMVSLDPETNADAPDRVARILKDAGAKGCPVLKKNVTVHITDLDMLEMYVGDPAEIGEMVLLADAETGEPIPPTDEGVLVSRRFSENYQVSVGDPIEISLNGTETVQTTVAGIFNTYIGRATYMSDNCFRNLFGRDPETNAFLVRLDGTELNPLLEKLGTVEGYESYERSDSFKSLFETATGVMNMVVLLFIFMAAVMAGVVLMNLTNIYIMQKLPELTIMRINGFTVREVVGYVLRETVVTTAAGILLGIGLGTGIGYKIVCSLEQSFVQFDRHPSIVAWIVGALMTIVFTVIVNAIALKKVRTLKLTDAA